MKLFATFDFRRIDKALVKSIQNNDTLFERKIIFFCVYKRISDCISSKTFLKRVNKILISFIFFIVEPLREPFPYLKTDLNQNYAHIFSEIKIWHFGIDLHCVEQNQSNYIRDALNVTSATNSSKCVIWSTGQDFFYFVEKLCSILKIFKFFYFKPSHNLTNLWRHDEY